MSQPYQQQPGPGAPGQQPFGAPPPYAQQPPASTGNPALAIGVAFVAAIVATAIYAFILKSLFDEQTGEVTKISYASILVGALIGAAIGKLGGRNVGLWIVGAVLAIGSVFMGEMYGYAMIFSELGDGQLGSATEILTDHFGDMFKGWREDMGAMAWIFMALAPIAAFGTASRLGNR
ncbi:hypothetical protein [Streptomyces sp. 184]|uniref:hypothetical protein n=1 Tax=Streptomyces sp. 184 TaxID=1827526 RepID=UPI0038918395